MTAGWLAMTDFAKWVRMSAPTALIPARGSKSSTRVSTAGFEVSISVSATDHLDGVFSGAHRAFWRARQVVFGVSIFAGLDDLDEVISGAQPAIFGPQWIDSGGRGFG